MSQFFLCPKCGAGIPYQVNLWMPWRKNPLFRCQQCAALLQRVHSRRSQLMKIGVCAAFLVTEAVVVWRASPVIFGAQTSSTALVSPIMKLVTVLLIYLLIMRLITHYTLVLRSDERLI